MKMNVAEVWFKEALSHIVPIIGAGANLSEGTPGWSATIDTDTRVISVKVTRSRGPKRGQKETIHVPLENVKCYRVQGMAKSTKDD